MSISIYWRFAVEGEDRLPAWDAAEDWLSADEQLQLSGFRFEKRRRDWLLGRLNAKALLSEMIEAVTGDRLEPARIEIARHPSGAPFVRLAGGARLPVVVSNTHSAGHALFAAAWTGGGASAALTLGADLEWIEPRSAGFIHDFLTPAERRYCDSVEGPTRDLRANLVWSAKESVLKALQRGLTADTYWLTCLPVTRGVEAEPALPDPAPVLAAVSLVPPDSAWQPLAVGALDPRLGADALSFGGLWRTVGGFVATLVVGR